MTNAPAPSAYVPNRSLPMKVQRRLTQWRVAKPLASAPERSIVSFTFDDFPKSAADTGAEIVESVGGHACYYACTGMAGTTNETGNLFDEGDITALLNAGHEIGAHTQTHLDCAVAAADTAVADIDQNLAALSAMGAGSISQFAYPYGETRTALKRVLPGKFTAARGVLAGVNGKGSDLMQLRALELEPGDWTTDRAAAAIETAARAPAWIVIFTHDVRSAPSPYGTTPAALTRLAKLARDSGAAIMTPSAALAEITGAGA